MPSYAIFLRGINVGGHHKVPMRELKETLEGVGCRAVKTFLASGNARCETNKQNPRTMAKKLEAVFKKQFGFDIPTIVLDGVALLRLVESNPFRDIQVGKNTRLYVTFFAEKPKHELKLPYTSPDKSFKLLDVTNTAAFSVLDISQSRTTDSMKFIEQTFGKRVTTRNWNTITKMV